MTKSQIATVPYCAAIQGFSVKFTTASQLATMLVEAKDKYQLSSIIKRYQSYSLLLIDELGYLPLAKTDAELLFQVFKSA